MGELSLVLKGATVIDGSGQPGFVADVGISDTKIMSIDRYKTLTGATIIDCSGLVVAPGFIDTHSHSDLMVLSDPSLQMKVRQGITMEVFGQDGLSVAPVKPQDRELLREQVTGLLGNPKVDWKWTFFGEYLVSVQAVNPIIDSSSLVSHGALRRWVVGMDDRHATPPEVQAMEVLLDRSLREGGIGLSTGLIYPPCSYSDMNELVELCKVVARHKGVFVVHMRSESDRILDAIEEVLEIANRSKVHLHISHWKIAGRENWKDWKRVIGLIEFGKSQGLKITADQYPYIAGSTMMGAILPGWVHSGGTDAAVNRLSSNNDREKIKAQILNTSRADWDNFWKWSGAEGILISNIASGRLNELEGKNIKEASLRRGYEEPLEFALDLLRDERLGVSMVSFSQSEEVVHEFMKRPYVCGCTDGLLSGRPHPRAYGTFPRILGRYVRALGILSLEEAVHKLSALPAEIFRLRGYGHIREGYEANIVIFDYENIRDIATYEDPCRFSVGVKHVIVHGQFVVKDELDTCMRPGIVFRANYLTGTSEK